MEIKTLYPIKKVGKASWNIKETTTRSILGENMTTETSLPHDMTKIVCLKKLLKPVVTIDRSHFPEAFPFFLVQLNLHHLG